MLNDTLWVFAVLRISISKTTSKVRHKAIFIHYFSQKCCLCCAILGIRHGSLLAYDSHCAQKLFIDLITTVYAMNPSFQKNRYGPDEKDIISFGPNRNLEPMGGINMGILFAATNSLLH